MSVVGNNRVGIPIVALHDAEGAVIEVETKKGELIRGLLFEAEDMMNLYIKVREYSSSFWNSQASCSTLFPHILFCSHCRFYIKRTAL